jgi:putative transposase
VILQQSLADLTTAYRRFFEYRQALREWQRAGRQGPKPKEVGLPRLKSRKDTRQGIRFTSNARFQVLPGGTLRLPKIGDVPVRWSRPLPSPPSSVTVIQDSAGRYFASFVVQAQADALPAAQPVVGIDWGSSEWKSRHRMRHPPTTP